MRAGSVSLHDYFSSRLPVAVACRYIPAGPLLSLDAACLSTVSWHLTICPTCRREPRPFNVCDCLLLQRQQLQQLLLLSSSSSSSSSSGDNREKRIVTPSKTHFVSAPARHQPQRQQQQHPLHSIRGSGCGNSSSSSGSSTGESC